MNVISEASGVSQSLFRAPHDGIAELVDSLLVACLKHDLEIVWSPDQCRVRSHAREWERVGDLPVRKSVFRALLARIAAKCKEFEADAVSPCGGRGTLCLGENPVTRFHAVMVNTPDEQRLELRILPV